MSIADRLDDAIDPLDPDADFEALAIRAEELQRWRDQMLLDDAWSAEKEDTLGRLESQMLDDFYPWMVSWVRQKAKKFAKQQKQMRAAVERKTKRQQRRENRLIADSTSKNADTRRAAKVTLGEIWPST